MKRNVVLLVIGTAVLATSICLVFLYRHKTSNPFDNTPDYSSSLVIEPIGVDSNSPNANTVTTNSKSIPVSSQYPSEKVDEALAWYRAFKNVDENQIDEGDIGQALISATVLSSVDGKQEEALAIFDSLLESKLQVHEKRQLQAETGSLLIRLATNSKGDIRKQYLSRAKKIADELLWVQDLWFGKAVAILAHIYMLEGDYDKALKLLDDYKPQLNQIDEVLKLQSTAENDLTNLSPLPEVRYVVGVIMQEKAKSLIALNGDKSEILKLLIGERNSKQSGALQHFLNVAKRYPNSEWANDAAVLAKNIVSLLDTRYEMKVHTPLDTSVQ